jgi:hypothetical protein
MRQLQAKRDQNRISGSFCCRSPRLVPVVGGYLFTTRLFVQTSRVLGFRPGSGWATPACGQATGLGFLRRISLEVILD